MESRAVSISTWSVVKVVLILLVVAFLYYIRDILALLFVAIILASILDPLASWGERYHIPRGISVIVSYVCLLTLITTLIVLLVPPMISQVQQISSELPTYWDKIGAQFQDLKVFSEQAGILDNVQEALSGLQSILAQSARGVLSTIAAIFGGLISFVLALVITFYIVVEEDALRRILRSVVPDHLLPYVTQTLRRIQEKIGAWARAQLLLCFIIFVFAYVGLTLIGVKYALVLALLAGLLEFIPYLGPILSAIPMVLFALADGPVRAGLALLVFVIIQQFENHVLVPQVMSRVVGLNPVVSIFALLIGARLGGPVGMILSIPVATALSVLLQDVVTEQKA
ncbi:MAG: AI-2E family transporter [Candidatus Yonathbacteria bacterium]|nr:AI-2E family transporter [Candidatus Yonathbacteria bacterium]